jgi:AcrR family transcriptional regulator
MAFTFAMAANELPEERIRALGQWQEARVAGARERMLAEAFVLFYAQGIRAVGIDLLIARSGVAKASFYRHFPSKVQLIVTYVDRRHEALLAWLSEAVTERASSPRDQLLAIFDALADLFTDADFHGCCVINAVAEVGADAPTVVAQALLCKAKTREYVASLAAAAGLAAPEAVAVQWELLIDGAFVAAQRTKDPSAAHAARQVAVLLLDATASKRRRLARAR